MMKPHTSYAAVGAVPSRTGDLDKNTARGVVIMNAGSQHRVLSLVHAVESAFERDGERGALVTFLDGICELAACDGARVALAEGQVVSRGEPVVAESAIAFSLDAGRSALGQLLVMRHAGAPSDQVLGDVELACCGLAASLDRRRTAKRAEEAEARSRALAEAVPDALLVVDRDGVISWTNSIADAVLDQPATRNLLAVLPDWGGGPGPVATDARRADGSTFSALVWSVPLGPDVMIVVRDVSDQRRAEASRALLHEANRAVSAAPDLASRLAAFASILRRVAAFDTMSFAIVEDDDRARVVAIWDAEGWRYPGERPSYRIESPRLLRSYAAGDAGVREDTAAPDADDEDRRLLARGVRSYISVPVVTGGKPRALLSLLASTPGAFTEADVPAIRSLVYEVAGSLNMLVVLQRERQAARRLRELDRLRSEYVEIVAHDLRSPLAVVSAAADVMRRHGDGFSHTERAKYLDMIIRTAQNVALLVDDVLTVATIESRDIRFEVSTFDLAELLDEAALEVATASPDRDIRVEAYPPVPRVRADRRRQWLVVTNLLSNAVKYTPRGTPIEIALAHEDGHVRVSVRDYGPGIPPEHLPSLFRKFPEIPREGEQAKKATGLGLYICKSLVEGQGGRIWVDSRPGEGTTFHYTVPSADEEASTEP